MGAAYISQQYLQNVLCYSTLEAGAAIIPAGVSMVLVAPRSARLVGAGSRLTLLVGQALVSSRSWLMFLLWREDISYWVIALPYVLLGIGVGLSGTPSSNSLTGSVPVPRRHGVRHGRPAARPRRRADDLDLRRTADRGLRIGDGVGARPVRPERHRSTQSQLQLSFASAEDLAASHPD